MAEVALKQFLKRNESGASADIPNTTLIYGDDMLSEKALDSLVNLLLPKGRQDLNLEFMDADEALIPTALEKLNTHSFLAQSKVLVLRDANWFYSKRDRAKLLEKAQTACENQKLKQSAAHLAAFCAQSDLDFEDLEAEHRPRLKLTATLKTILADADWLDPVLTYCRQHKVTIGSSEPRLKMLADAIQKGFPKQHYLIIMADRVLKTHGLYKNIDTSGMLVDCRLPKGQGFADVKARQELIREHGQALVTQNGKTMAAEAFKVLMERTGDDLRSAMNAIQKVLDYVGDASHITPKDVAAVTTSTREDPLFAFTNAVVERNYVGATQLAERLLESGVIAHPLPLVAAIANQLRRLMIMRQFMDQQWKEGQPPRMPYNRYVKEIVPMAQKVDQHAMDHFDQLETEFSLKAVKPKKSRKKSPKSKIPGELLLASHGRSHYAGYQLFLKTTKFSATELMDGFFLVQEIDTAIKAGRVDAHIGLARILLAVCNPK